MAFAYAVKRYTTEGVSIGDTLERLGLRPKIKIWPSLKGATFLKGSFFHSSLGEIGWYPIPNCAKWGKFLTNPAAMAREGGEHRSVVTPHRAALRILQASALSVKIPDNMPIMAAYKRAALRVTEEEEVTAALIERVKTIRRWRRTDSAASDTVARDEVLDFIEERYGLSQQDVEDAEALLDSVVSAPFFVSHPVFRVMSEVDYG